MKSITEVILTALFLISTLSSSAQTWHVDLDTAKKEAHQQSKSILLSFQGSDWCIPCIKLEKEIWHSEEFKEYADNHLILVKADFPRRKKNALSKDQQNHNATLAESYNPQGIFPLVVLMHSDGSRIAETGYKKMKAQSYINHLIELLSKE